MEHHESLDWKHTHYTPSTPPNQVFLVRDPMGEFYASPSQLILTWERILAVPRGPERVLRQSPGSELFLLSVSGGDSTFLTQLQKMQCHPLIFQYPDR